MLGNDFLFRAQIFDSPPDYNSIAFGISKSMGINGPMEKVVESFAGLYLKLAKNGAGVLHRKSSQMFHENYVSAPALWYYSRADPVARFEDCETVISKWKNNGILVEQCVWEDTPHIQHGRLDPERYFGTLKTFLEENRIVPAEPVSFH